MRKINPKKKFPSKVVFLNCFKLLFVETILNKQMSNLHNNTLNKFRLGSGCRVIDRNLLILLLLKAMLDEIWRKTRQTHSPLLHI
jgi:hypothetical protein